MMDSKVWVQRFRCHGTIVARRHGGYELSVRLEPPLSLTVWMRREDVTFDPAAADGGQSGAPPAIKAAVIEAPAAPKSTPMPSPGLRAAQQRLDRMEPTERARWRSRVGRNVIEALRFGLVPRYAVEALSVGLDLERRLFAADLAAARKEGAIRVLSASYGTGKSHALDVIQMMALRENFVVARVELDAFECRPNQPREIFRGLVRSLRVPGAPEGGLGFLLDRAADSPSVASQFTARNRGGWHDFLGPALLNWQGLSGDEGSRDVLLQWISGEDVDLDETRLQVAVRTPRQQLLSLGSYSTLSSHFTYLLSGLSSMATLLGFSGLAILMDEAEHLRLLSVDMESRATDFFRGLAYNAVGRNLPSNYLAGCYLGGRKKIPFHWRLPANIYLVMACTPAPGRDTLLDWVPAPGHVAVLPGRLSAIELDTLIERIATSYRWAFPALPAPGHELRRKLAGRLHLAIASGALLNLRQIVQTVVGGLDLVRSGDGWSWDRVADELDRFVDGRLPAAG